MASYHQAGETGALPISIADTTTDILSVKTEQPWRGHEGQGLNVEGRYSEAQLELAVDDDGLVEGGDDDIMDEGVTGAVDEDDQSYMYLTEATGYAQSLFETATITYCTNKTDTIVRQEEMQQVRLDDQQAECTDDPGNVQSAEPDTGASLPLYAREPPTVNQQTNTFPLGSSQNPIRIIQQGNKYTSLQQLSPEQLSQIMQVIQQQQMMQSNKSSSVLFNQETQTKIVYRIVYPADVHSAGRKKIRRSQDDTGSETSGQERVHHEPKKKHRPRTRSGRVCRPPQYMVKDYKHIHPVDYNVEEDGASDGGYSDFKESSDEGGLDDSRSKVSEDSTVPVAASGKPKSFKCSTCEKRYIGQGGLARHYRLQPSHGKLEDLADAICNSNDSFQSGSISSSTPGQPAPHGATSFSGTVMASVAASASPVSQNDVMEGIKQDAIPSATVDTDAAVNADTVVVTPAVVPKRKRGRPPASTQMQVERRKEKLRELVQQCNAEELAEVVLPRLAPSFSLWQYLALRATASAQSDVSANHLMTMLTSCMSHVDVAFMLDEYATLHRQVRDMCSEKLVANSSDSLDTEDTHSALRSEETCNEHTASSDLQNIVMDSDSNGCYAVMTETTADIMKENGESLPENSENISVWKPSVIDAGGGEADNGSAADCVMDSGRQSEGESEHEQSVKPVFIMSADSQLDVAGIAAHSDSSVDMLNDGSMPAESSAQIGADAENIVSDTVCLMKDSKVFGTAVDGLFNVTDAVTSNVTSVAKEIYGTTVADQTFNCDATHIDNCVEVDLPPPVAIVTDLNGYLPEMASSACAAADVPTAPTLITTAAQNDYYSEMAATHYTVAEQSAQNEVNDQLLSVSDVKSALRVETSTISDVGDSNCGTNEEQASVGNKGKMQESDSVISAAESDIQPTTVDTPVDVGSDEQPNTLYASAVKTIDDMLEISSEELAQCLGLSVGTLYRVKRTQPPTTTQNNTSATILTNDSMENLPPTTSETVVTDPQTTPSLPPRKRIRMLQPELQSFESSTDSIAADQDSQMANCKNVDFVDTCNSDVAIATSQPTDVLDSADVVESKSTITNGVVDLIESLPVTVVKQETKSPASRVPLIRAAVSQPTFTSRPAAMPKRGRRPKQMMSVLRPVVTTSESVPSFHVPNSSLDTSNARGVNIGVVAPADTFLPPGVIQIPENAQVLQTEDGMVIVCHPDGTIQIHGHTEGKAFPLDAVRALLGLNDSQHTLVAVNNDQITMDTSQSVIGLDGSEVLMTVDGSQALFEMGANQQLVTMDGTQTLVSVGNQSYLTMDGNQTLMAVDPSSQALVGINPMQAVMTADDGQTLVAINNGQTMVTVDCAHFTGNSLIG